MQTESHLQYSNMENAQSQEQPIEINATINMQESLIANPSAQIKEINQHPIVYIMQTYPTHQTLGLGLPHQVVQLEQPEQLTSNNNTLVKNLPPHKQFQYSQSLLYIWFKWQICQITLVLLFFVSVFLVVLTHRGLEAWRLSIYFFVMLFITICLLIVGSLKGIQRDTTISSIILALIIFCLAIVQTIFFSSSLCEEYIPIIENNPRLPFEVIMLFEVLELLSVVFVKLFTLFGQQIHIKKYLLFSSIFALILIFIDFVVTLSMSLATIAVIIIIFPLQGILIMISMQQILNGKFELEENQTSSGAILLYVNLFVASCFNK